MWVRNPLRKDKEEKRKISRFTDAIQRRNRGYLMLFKFLSFFSESSVFVTFAKKNGITISCASKIQYTVRANIIKKYS